MALSTLVVSCDPQLLQKIIPVFELAGIDTEVCTRAEDAQRKIASTRYDATVIDCASLPGARGVLDGVRRSSNRSAVTFAIVSEITSPRDAAMLGASFVLEKSFTQDWLLHNLRAAQGLMASENRRYYRHPADFIAWVQRPGDRSGEIPVSAENVSQGGLGIQTTASLTEHSLVELRFTLPGDSSVDAQAEVLWARDGRAGLQFTRMSSKSRARLVAWLMEQYDRTQPPLPSLPPSMGSAPRTESFGPQGRRLMCHAFAQNLPIAWKCSGCGWRHSIKLEETRWRYANEPPEPVVSAFETHECVQHPAGSVFRS
ncbi:MAG: PilZ domain-containing protein [Acidobacteriia bacterium]|nr:PilZ domain-containing protein [Terriglobia bacterium]